MARKPAGLIRRTSRAATGGTVVVLAILAVMFLQGGGLGPGGANTTQSQKDFKASADPGDTLLTSGNTSTDETASGGLTDEEKRALSGDVLIVLIDEHSYFLQTSDNPVPQYHPVDIDRLVTLAGTVPGDTNGIRVRVEKRVTARAAAEHELRVALEKAGISRDAIFESSELVR